MHAHRVSRSIAVRLWASLAAIVLALVGFHLWLVHQERDLADTAVERAEHLAGMIERLLIHELEHDHAERFLDHLRIYEDGRSVLAVRLLKADTGAAFSGRPADAGAPWAVSDSLIPCAACHVQGGGAPPHTHRVIDEATGRTRMVVARPLGDNAECGRCHARDEAHRATLHVTLAGSDQEIAQATARRRLSLAATGVLAVTIAILGVLVNVLLSRPLRGLRRGVERVAGGDLTTRVPVPESTELAELASSFNAMTERIEETHRTQEATIRTQLHELEASQAKLVHQEKLAGLGMMAAGIAHEVGNPLASISAAAQVLRRRTEDPFIRKQVESILAQIERISRIVRDLSDFSRPPSLAAADTQVNELVETAVGLLTHDRRFRRIAIHLELDRTLPRIPVIPDHLLEIFFNLGLNAVEAMEESVPAELRITTSREGGYVRVRFCDTGPGVPEALRSRIFEPFFTTRAPGKGTGLGLSVSYGLARSLGGDLVLANGAGAGACFVVTIPTAGPPSESEGNEDEPHARDLRTFHGS